MRLASPLVSRPKRQPRNFVLSCGAVLRSGYDGQSISGWPTNVADRPQAVIRFIYSSPIEPNNKPYLVRRKAFFKLLCNCKRQGPFTAFKRFSYGISRDITPIHMCKSANFPSTKLQIMGCNFRQFILNLSRWIEGNPSARSDRLNNSISANTSLGQAEKTFRIRICYIDKSTQIYNATPTLLIRVGCRPLRNFDPTFYPKRHNGYLSTKSCSVSERLFNFRSWPFRDIHPHPNLSLASYAAPQLSRSSW